MERESGEQRQGIIEGISVCAQHLVKEEPEKETEGKVRME